MPEEGIDEVVASAFGLAAFYLQNSILTALVAKGHLTMNEAALTVSGAAQLLDEMGPTSLSRLAKEALTSLADSWQRQAKGD